MEKRYEHQRYEEKIYRNWKKSGRFTPPPYHPGEKTFTIIMPPPNANNPLHVGHACFVTIEDILIRYHRMLQEATLWLPGTDHAGIETQYVFEQKLKAKGKSRFDFDRQALYQMIWDYVKENSQTAIMQMKRLGASADWSRLRFTLEPDIVKDVVETFIKMQTDGLIYRDLRLVNYCPRCGTSYSELEVVHQEQNDPLYFIKYGPFELATVRPETKFGDTAVAVHPKDQRYSQWVGKEIEVVGLLGKFNLTVIADELVDPEFGTGVVKVTPAHDPNDFEIGQRHGLELKQIIGFDGKLTDLTGPYQGLTVKAAREKVVDDLKARGLMTQVDENYRHTVAKCYRCGTILEPLPRPQFFIKVKSLTQLALKALAKGETQIYGAGHDKILIHWLKNLKDWNISRQIVWGIRIPVWYRIDTSHKTQATSINNQIIVGFLDKEKKLVKGEIGKLLESYSFEEIETGLQMLMAPPEAEYKVARAKPGANYLQETDTFDTWFSSSQWPVVTLQAPGNKQQDKSKVTDFERFYPTSVMETAYDILPFWVMRMMMMGCYLTGKTPFTKVYFHGLVRDEQGHKMSKSRGNVVNPLLLVETYGADALRMALVMSTTAGHDSNVGETKVKGMRNFSNKIWNGARFIKINREETGNKKQETSLKTKKYIKHLNQVVKLVTKQLNELKIGLAAETVHNQFWHWWCDEVLEANKRLEVSDAWLEEGMKTWLKLLQPFVPFVTEAVWQELYPQEELLMGQVWPAMEKKV
ncbi:valine--tRNA ligase [Microgenomates group bacterium RBG_16_45_19]|nr:MAG: valine--tRNA ligase [Microgenomates group bacterium RBG_16_45_19]